MLEKECKGLLDDEAEGGDEDEAEVEAEDGKTPRWLCIYKGEEGELKFVTATTANKMKKEMEDIPIDAVVLVWKGKPKMVRVRSVYAF